MRSVALRVLSLACLLVFALPFAATARGDNFDLYSFDTPEQEARFEALTQQLRCPKCQNNDLADSGAPIAKDLRQRVYELIRAGKSDDEIVAYLKARYGDFITYKPPFNPVTFLLWTGPFLLLAIAAPLLVWRLRRRTAVAPPVAVEKTRVRDILARYDAPAGPDAAHKDRRP